MTSSEPDSAELQEAVSKTTFKHEFSNLEAATTYSIYLKAYSALGGSQQSDSIMASTLGGGRSPLTDNTENTHTISNIYKTSPSEDGATAFQPRKKAST